MNTGDADRAHRDLERGLYVVLAADHDTAAARSISRGLFMAVAASILTAAASILTAAYIMLRDGVEYRDLGHDYFDRLDKTRPSPASFVA